jgi:sulfur carrier protein ThiS
MELIVDVAGGQTHEVALEGGDAYGDRLDALDVHRERAAVLVDGAPVPTDAVVDASAVRVVRLVKGG